MKKILIVADEALLQREILNQAIDLAKSQQAMLVGLFMIDFQLFEYFNWAKEDTFYYDVSIEAVKEELNKAQEQTYALVHNFVKQCQKANIHYKVRIEKGAGIQEFIAETKFADLIVVGYKTYFSNQLNDTDLVKKLLHKSECPVLLLSENGASFDNLILCYDGSASSIKAINAVYHFFGPTYFKNTYLIHVANTNEVTIDSRLIDLLRGRYPKLHVKILQGNPEEEITYFAEQLTKSILVMGAYGHSGINSLWKGRTTEKVIKRGSIPTLLWH